MAHTALSVQLCVRLCQLAWETNDLGVHRKELEENHRKGPAACQPPKRCWDVVRGSRMTLRHRQL